VSSGRPNSIVKVVSLGCPKNDADTEVMLGMLAENGYRFVSEPERADILLINTCAFIRPAVEESVGFVQEAVDRKRLDPNVKIVVAGCLPQRWRVSGETVPPEIDCVLGTGQYQRIAEALDRVAHGRTIRWLGEPRYLPPATAPRIRITPPHYAYVKIADGCDNRCSYCLIPSLRGRYRSRSVRAIVSEARDAVASGAKEIVLVGQDTTLYGKDRSGSADLAALLRAVSRIDGVQWIRVLYTYPTHFSERLVETMRDLPNVVPYLDIPLQHSHDEILARMNRKSGSDEIRRLIDTLRETIGGVAIRTTFIVGFPGERERHFAHLMRFIERMRLDRAGVFTYWRESGTRAAAFPDQVHDEVKEARRAAAMSLQQEISLENNRRLIGTRLTALIDGVCASPVEDSTEDQWCVVGRTYRDAPEIDGQIFVDDDSLAAGTMVEVEVTGAQAYDLIGRKV